jgi:hypothetical protein
MFKVHVKNFKKRKEKQKCSLTSKHLKNLKRTKMELEIEKKEYKK